MTNSTETITTIAWDSCVGCGDEPQVKVAEKAYCNYCLGK